MNNFTKEELHHMANGLALIQQKCKMSEEIEREITLLSEKLESMIDDYTKLKPSLGELHQNE